MELGRPLKWVEDRVENFLGAYQGRGVEASVELALDAGGRILAVRASIRCRPAPTAVPAGLRQRTCSS